MTVPVEAVVARDRVGAAAQQQPVVARGPDVERRRDQLVAVRGSRMRSGDASDLHGGQRRERCRSRKRDAHLRLAEHGVAVEGDGEVDAGRRASASSCPTFAMTETAAPSAGSTTTGRVNRT